MSRESDYMLWIVISTSICTLRICGIMYNGVLNQNIYFHQFNNNYLMKKLGIITRDLI